MGDEKDVLHSHPCGAESDCYAPREWLHRNWVGMGMHMWAVPAAALGSPSHSQCLWAGVTCVRLDCMGCVYVLYIGVRCNSPIYPTFSKKPKHSIYSYLF